MGRIDYSKTRFAANAPVKTTPKLFWLPKTKPMPPRPAEKSSRLAAAPRPRLVSSAPTTRRGVSLSPSAQTSRLRGGLSLYPNHKAPPLHRNEHRKEDAHGQHGSHDGKNDEHGRDRNTNAELGLHGHAAM